MTTPNPTPATPTAPTPAWHQLAPHDALAQLGSSPTGLTGAEAAIRLEKHGPNAIVGEAGRSLASILVEQLTNAMVLILLAAALISLFKGDVVAATSIFVIVTLATTMGAYQELKAEQALAALARLAAPNSRVLRDGKIVEIPATDLVPGDVIPLQPGDIVPADCRLVEAHEVAADEKVLTGESVPADKTTHASPAGDIAIGDRHSMMFSGTAVVRGRALAAVVATGMHTEFGKIAQLLSDTEALRTPLQRDLDKLTKTLGYGSLALAAAVAVLGILRGQPVLDMLVWGVALAVAVIPEALPAVVAISLSLGVQRMAKRNALVRKLTAVEALGSTQVVCSDKTGTLTLGRMAVHRLLIPGREAAPVSGPGTEGSLATIGHEGSPTRALFEAAALCNDARLGTAGGDPTEVALVEAAQEAGIDLDRLYATWPRVAERPFSSETKRMSTLHRHADGAHVEHAKGAVEEILPRASTVVIGGAHIPLDDALRARVLAQAHELAKGGLRVLAIATRKAHAPSIDERELCYLGALAMIDPPRDSAKPAVASCRAAGVRTVMITGDQPETARTIARELTILVNDVVVTGPELAAMDQATLDRRVDDVEVFARVAPEHKLRIVEAFQRKGYVVAMTGDGVNDAPALKRADIGIAMGKGGTEVSREASKMVLLDDDFATIAKAIEEGRRIVDNIRKYLVFLLGGNLGAIFALVFALLADWPVLLTAVQVLFINLLLDGLPAIALGVEPADPHVMKRPPRRPGAPILGLYPALAILGLGVVVAALSLAHFHHVWRTSGDLELARGAFFATLVACRLAVAYVCRSWPGSTFVTNPFSNTWLVAGVGLALALAVTAVQWTATHEVFKLVPLAAAQWQVVAVAAALVLLVGELSGAVERVRRARARR